VRPKYHNHGIWFVYILGSLSGTLYIGFTGRLEARVFEHKEGLLEGFTKKYGVDRLLYYESFDRPLAGIDREKQLQGWRREKKIALLERMNPHWKDLSREWYEEVLRRRAEWASRSPQERARSG
jgi:putative endonuclease